MRHPMRGCRAVLLVTIAVAAQFFCAAASNSAAPASPLHASGRRPKTCVYAIALNERMHVESFMDACKGADLVLVADTGSTDGTPEALRAAGAEVHTITVKPWRFDVARNMSLDLLPADCDLCLSLDLDEQLQPGWVEALQEAWAKPGAPPTSVRYDYIWSFLADGVTPSKRFLQTKFHARWNYTWRDPAHELPYWTGAPGKERQVTLLNLKVHHHADPSKSRGSYLSLLKLGAEEDPSDARRSYYYGRELVFQKQHAAAVEELERYLALPGAWWKEERCAALQYIAQCHEALGQHKEAQAAARRAIAEWDKDREPFMALARASRLLGDWPTCRWAATAALAIKEKRPSSFGDGTAWGAAPYDELALALHNLGRHKLAVKAGRKAVKLSPDDKRLQDNLGYYLAKLPGQAATREMERDQQTQTDEQIQLSTKAEL